MTKFTMGFGMSLIQKNKKKIEQSTAPTSLLSSEISTNHPLPTFFAFMVLNSGGKHNATHTWKEIWTIVEASALIHTYIMGIKHLILFNISVFYCPQSLFSLYQVLSSFFRIRPLLRFTMGIMPKSFQNFLKISGFVSIQKNLLFPAPDCQFQFTRQQVFRIFDAINSQHMFCPAESFFSRYF